MKHINFLTIAAVIGLLTTPALADNHKKGDHDGKHRGKMFEKLDSNSDGSVSEEEFLNAHKHRFSEIDVDGDGSISKEEAQSHHEKRKEKWQEYRENRKEKQQENNTE